jgi:hypothetical protein
VWRGRYLLQSIMQSLKSLSSIVLAMAQCCVGESRYAQSEMRNDNYKTTAIWKRHMLLRQLRQYARISGRFPMITEPIGCWLSPVPQRGLGFPGPRRVRFDVPVGSSVASTPVNLRAKTSPESGITSTLLGSTRMGCCSNWRLDGGANS